MTVEFATNMTNAWPQTLKAFSLWMDKKAGEEAGAGKETNCRG
jgi:hypothetical protein